MARRAVARLILSQPAARWDMLGEWLRIRVNLLGDKAHKLSEGLSTACDLDDFYYNLLSEWKQPATIAQCTREAPTLARAARA